MLPAFDAILGHKSAHSFATGPVMAEPTKEKNLYLKHSRQVHYKGVEGMIVYTKQVFRKKNMTANNVLTFHFTLDVNNHTCII